MKITSSEFIVHILINVDFIQHLEQTGKESYQIILKNSKQLPVSKTGLAKLRNTL